MLLAFAGALLWTVLLSQDAEKSSALYSRFEGPIMLFSIGAAILIVLNHPSPESSLSRRTAAWVVLGLALVVAAVAGYTFFDSRYGDLRATMDTPIENVATGKAHELAVTVEGSPPYQGSLELTPTIVRTGKLGDCVVPATLGLTLLADGVPRDDRVVRSGDRTSLNVPAGTRRIALEIQYINADGAECRVRISLADGLLVR